MTIADQFVLALTAWRENRGGGIAGMQSVINVVCNRSTHRRTDAYTECVRPMQFSSLTAKGDPELTLWPADNDPQWLEAIALAGQAAVGTLEDITDGSNLYFSPVGIGQTTKTFVLPDGTSIPFPMGWNPAAVTYKTKIAGQYFFIG
jgi:hypothetical protein